MIFFPPKNKPISAPSPAAPVTIPVFCTRLNIKGRFFVVLLLLPGMVDNSDGGEIGPISPLWEG